MGGGCRDKAEDTGRDCDTTIFVIHRRTGCGRVIYVALAGQLRAIPDTHTTRDGVYDVWLAGGQPSDCGYIGSTIAYHKQSSCFKIIITMLMGSHPSPHACHVMMRLVNRDDGGGALEPCLFHTLSRQAAASSGIAQRPGTRNEGD